MIKRWDFNYDQMVEAEDGVFVDSDDYDALAAAIIAHFQLCARLADAMFARQEAGAGIDAMLPLEAERAEMLAAHARIAEVIGPELTQRFLKSSYLQPYTESSSGDSAA